MEGNVLWSPHSDSHMLGSTFISWKRREKNRTLKYEAGGSRRLGFHWEEFVINVDAEVSQMQWACRVYRVNTSSLPWSGALSFHAVGLAVWLLTV